RRQRLDAQPRYELAPLRAHLEHADASLRGQRELHDRKSDGPRPDPQRVLARPQSRARHRVRADPQRLDQRKLIEREPLRLVQALDRHGDEFSHPAVGVYAQDFEALAAVVLAGAAGVALAAAQIRLDGAAVALTDASAVRGNLDHLDAQLVAEHARVSEVRLASGKGVQVRAADPD